MSRRWIVQATGPSTVGQVLDCMEDPEAFAEGRAFVGKIRATRREAPLPPGSEVIIYPPRKGTQEPRVLGERDGVLALFKPAPLPTIADHRGDRCLLRWACDQVHREDLHTTSRLDVGVSGVVLIACDRAARDRLALAREQHQYRRVYLAIAPSGVTPGTWTWSIGKGKGNRRAALPPGTPGALDARTHATLLASTPRAALLRVEPVSGRTHQIRVHAAAIGHSLVGDGKYGGKESYLTGGISRKLHLHSRRLQIALPDGGTLDVKAELPPHMAESWQMLGFDLKLGDIEIVEPPPPPLKKRRLSSATSGNRRGERRSRGATEAPAKPLRKK
jgi:23S rRNA-/tRNA-specific pseudouridylate synthase